jgi:hypothetical protein
MKNVCKFTAIGIKSIHTLTHRPNPIDVTLILIDGCDVIDRKAGPQFGIMPNMVKPMR